MGVGEKEAGPQSAESAALNLHYFTKRTALAIAHPLCVCVCMRTHTHTKPSAH